MSNSYFQFKQFRIEQERCAMKVTTDACIQGAWTPLLQGVKRVLDIGAGTGLLSLMLAQRNEDILIDTVELEHDAFEQAKENIQASTWKNRVAVTEGDVRAISATHKYELIITNPPFFIDSLLSDKEAKNNARHALSLTQPDLFETISNNLSDNGYASVLLPAAEYALWCDLMSRNGWSEVSRLDVKHRPGAEIKRIVGLFKRQLPSAEPVVQTLTIRDDDNNYTREFTELMRPFYLHF